MATVALSTFYPDIQIYAPDVAYPIIDRSIVDAAAEFSKRTGVLRQDVSTIVSSSNVVAITYFTSLFASTCRLDKINKIWIASDGNEIKQVTPDWLDRNMSGWRNGISGSEYLYATQVDTDEIQFVPELTTSTSIFLNITGVVKQNASSLPDVFDNLYKDALVYGTLSRLFEITMLSIFNPEMANYYRTKFEQEIAKSCMDKSRGMVNATKTTRSRFF